MRIVVLHGQESFLMSEYSRSLQDSLEEAYGEIDLFHFDGEEAELADVLDELRSYDLLQQHKLVIVDNADAFIAREGHRPILERYAAAPVDSATLLMRAPRWRPGNFDRAVKKVGNVAKVTELTERTAVSWCIKRCDKRHDATIERNAAQMLVERLGPELMRLDQSLMMLATYVGSGETITGDDVQTFVQPGREEQAWKVQAAIASGSPGKALHKLNELKTVSRAADQVLFWSIADLIRKLHTASHMLRSGVPRGVIVKELRFWGDEGHYLLSAAGHYPPEHFAQLLRSAVQLDAAGKSGKADSSHTLEGLAVTLSDTVSCST